MARAPARAHEVPGDERLAVPRRERMRGAPERSDEQRDEDHADREVAAVDQRLEPAAACAPARPARRAPAARPARLPGVNRTSADRTSSGEDEELVRVGAQLVRTRLVDGDR